MDLNEMPDSPHPHHNQLEIVILVGPDPFTTTIQTTAMEPNTAQGSPFNMNVNLSPNHEPLVSNIVPSSLNPCLSAIIPHVIFVNPGEVCSGTYNSNINMLYITLPFSIFFLKYWKLYKLQGYVDFDDVKNVVVYRIFESFC
jgi:hypothetical protein